MYVFLDRVNLWSDNSGTPDVFGFTGELRGPGLICLHPTPDLDHRWQALVITERSPLSLEESALITMGFHYIRRESNVEKWESQDWRVRTGESRLKRAHEVYAQ